MGFPSTPIRDNFNRANGAVGANWSDIFTGGAVGTITSNVVGSDGTGSTFWESRYNVARYGPDTEVYATLSTIPTGVGCALWARQNGLQDGSCAGYWMSIDVTGTPDTWAFNRYIGSNTAVGSTFTQNVANGDAFGFCVKNNNNAQEVILEAWYKAAAGSWTLLSSQKDTSASRITSDGYIGLDLGPSSVKADDWGGGTVLVSNPQNYSQFPKYLLRTAA